MTSDERATLIEDIDHSANIRAGIVEQARLSKEFDIAAAWVELEEPDESINKRVSKARFPRPRASSATKTSELFPLV